MLSIGTVFLKWEIVSCSQGDGQVSEYPCPLLFSKELQFKIIKMSLGNILGWPARALTVSSSETVLEAHILNAELGTGEGETELVNEW